MYKKSLNDFYLYSSGDATARLWQVPENKDDVSEPMVLNHLPNLNDNKDVTTLDWNVSFITRF